MTTDNAQKPMNVNYEIFILALSLLSLVNLLLEILPIDAVVKNVVQIVDVTLTPIFLGDFLHRLIQAPGKRAYLIKGGGWLDFLGSLPFPGLRVMRVFRMWRVYRELRRMGVRNLRRAYRKARAETALLTIIFLVVVVLEFASIFVLVAERHAPNANIKTASDALWWAYQTVTTVGYGDKYPVTNAGRIVGVLLMIIGVGLFGVLTSYLANSFLKPAPEEQHERENGNGTIAPDDLQSGLEEIRHILLEQEKSTAELKRRIEALDRAIRGRRTER